MPHTMTDAASEILERIVQDKTWVTRGFLDLCDERRDKKHIRYKAGGANTGKLTKGFRGQ